MADDQTLKEQRDRFLAFAFASADLFIEISDEGKIVFTAGAAKSITGIDDKTLIKKNWLDLFSAYEQSKMQRARELAKPGGRFGPILVTLNEQIVKRQAVLSAIKMPGNGKFYIALGVGNDLIAQIAPLLSLPGSSFAHGADDFADAARNAIFDAKLWGQPVEMTFFDFGPTTTVKEKFSAEDWPEVQKLITETLAVYSFGGSTAGEISDGRYSFVHDPAVSAADMKQKIDDIVRKYSTSGESLEIKDTTITTDFVDISKREIDRAVTYAVDKFEESKDGTIEIKSLKSGYKAYLSENEQKLKELRGFIERVSFIQHFQPIVDIATRELSHYEILTRFESGDSEEWISFAQDVGLAPNFDIAVCERAVNYIKFKAGGTRTRFSIDISGQSITDDKFMERLKEQVDKHKGIAERLTFEIRETMNIENLEKAGKFTRELGAMGFNITLDDFSAGSTCLHYLQNLKAHAVKIDGRRNLRGASSKRDTALLQNLARTCKDMEIDIIAEFISDENQAKTLAALGVKYGQGDLYAAAGTKPDYIAKKPA